MRLNWLVSGVPDLRRPVVASSPLVVTHGVDHQTPDTAIRHDLHTFIKTDGQSTELVRMLKPSDGKLLAERPPPLEVCQNGRLCAETFRRSAALSAVPSRHSDRRVGLGRQDGALLNPTLDRLVLCL